MSNSYATESDLCAAFADWASQQPLVTGVYAEWAGWDLLLTLEGGAQVGIQAKLRLNAAVINQALAGVQARWRQHARGPDFRAVLVPKVNAHAGLAENLGLEVFRPRDRAHEVFRPGQATRAGGFWPRLEFRADIDAWVDWSPPQQLALPATATDSVAGSPCPVTLTAWKLRALAVLAELEVEGSITTRRMSELRVAPARWIQGRWLVSDKRGVWRRGTDCPHFEEQHPSAYAAALARARERAA